MKLKKGDLTDKQKTELNNIANYILEELDVDVRNNTKSRKHDLPKYRTLFFIIALEHVNIGYTRLALFLDKDHATMNHSVKTWDSFLCFQLSRYLVNYKPILNKNNKHSKRRKSAFKISENEKLQEDIVKLNILELEIKKKNRLHKNDVLNEFMLLDKQDIELGCETRLKPFLKMLNSRKTHEDILSERKESIYG